MRKGGANGSWEPYFVGSYNHSEDVSFIHSAVGTRKTVRVDSRTKGITLTLLGVNSLNLRLLVSIFALLYISKM